MLCLAEGCGERTSDAVLFENPGHGNRWITLVLEGTRSNRSGVGARIRVTVRTDRATREIFRTVSTGGSFGSSTLQQEIGLGPAAAIEALRIDWPSGQRQQLRDLEPDRAYRIREGQAVAVPLERQPITLGR